MFRVLAVDDDFRVRAAYDELFQDSADFTLVGLVQDGQEAIEAYERLRPDVVLMDLQMPGRSGVEAIEVICSRWPGACVVAMTAFATKDYIVGALHAGAAGYLVKGTHDAVITAALRQAMAGDMPLSRAVRRELVSTLLNEGTTVSQNDYGLAPRELELLEWLAHGLTNAQIAARMFISEGSVKQYLTRISTKLEVSSRTQVLVRAIQLGLVDPYNLPPVHG